MIYLDNAATTHVTRNIFSAVEPYLKEKFGNPGSPHLMGIEAERAIGRARRQVAQLINCNADNLLFTSGGSEANTLAILGLERYLKSIGRTHIITDKAEHESVLNACAEMERRGFEVTYTDVDYGGHVNVSEIKNSLTCRTGLIISMMANNELGSVNDVEAISEICRYRDILFHCDCVQAALGIPINSELFDSCSVSGHKFHAPKGVGAVFLKEKRLYNNVIYGGEQEFGMRPGTQNVPFIVGMGEAAEYCKLHNDEISQKINSLAEAFVNM